MYNDLFLPGAIRKTPTAVGSLPIAIGRVNAPDSYRDRLPIAIGRQKLLGGNIYVNTLLY